MRTYFFMNIVTALVILIMAENFDRWRVCGRIIMQRTEERNSQISFGGEMQSGYGVVHLAILNIPEVNERMGVTSAVNVTLY